MEYLVCTILDYVSKPFHAHFLFESVWDLNLSLSFYVKISIFQEYISHEMAT